jgi:serine phosphatase RsbU (regulator of sigma subunit)
VDAESASGTRFTKERLIALSTENRDKADKLVDNVVNALRQHLGNLPPSDDITLLAIRKTEGVAAGTANHQG